WQILIRSIEFTPDEREPGHRRRFDLVVNLLHSAADHLIARNELLCPENILCTIISVHVRRNEINRNVVLFAIADESVSPRSLGGRMSANADLWAGSLESARSVLVELPVGVLPRIAAPEIEIGLVPDFEIPLAHFLDAISAHEMFGQSRHQV